MKTLCVIPARGGSKRVKNKNIRLLNGIPLIAYTIRDAQEAQSVAISVVSTDDEKIAVIALKEGVKCIMRPIEYATDEAPIYFALRHAVKEIERSEGWLPDIVVWLQPNVPFREKGLVDRVIKKLIDNFEKTDTVSTVFEADQHPESMKIIRGDLLEFREKPMVLRFRTQEMPKTYMHDGSVQAIKTKVLMDESIPQIDGHFYMGRIMPFIHDFPYILEVDHEEDFYLLEYVLNRKLIPEAQK
ncbi:MAG: N-acylneuraminate cytidylyltransferase [Candidatus Saganbacteria bacterium]|uniref:N-acylneuraminate cytidylyltransferase n=1 Tax=Candidatus Saganbacteria bacterium TaxID=2575572 RepID=A0A833L2I2_UNCSA|nr:MAG: N-acylneuraminate cytidylyltransferase [Candidatus Saganbacteria bacterium]